MKLYLKIFNQTEINDIIDQVVKSFDTPMYQDHKWIYPEEICEIYSDRGVMPWQLYPAFVDAGKSKYFKIKNYGNIRLLWTPERKARLWELYWVKKVNDWDIAKEFGSTWQTIKRMRSHFHHDDNDPRWVKFIHTTRKGLASTQEKLKHTDSEFVGSERLAKLQPPLFVDDTVIDLRGSTLTQEKIQDIAEKLERGEFEENLKLLEYREDDKKLWKRLKKPIITEPWENVDMTSHREEIEDDQPMWSEKAIEAGSEELQSIQKEMGINEVEVTSEESDAMIAKMIKEQLKTDVFSDFVSFTGPIIEQGELAMVSATSYIPWGKAFKVLEKEYRELRKDFEVVSCVYDTPTLHDIIINSAHECLPKSRIYDKDLRAALTYVSPLELVKMVQNPSYILTIEIDHKKFLFTLSKIDPFNKIGIFYLAYVIDNSAK